MVGDRTIVPAGKNCNKMDFKFKAFETSDLEFSGKILGKKTSKK